MTRLADTAKDYLMRYTPAALSLSLLALVSASATQSAPGDGLRTPAARLVAQGDVELAAGRANAAIDAYEAALVIQPGNAKILVSLAAATRSQGMQGKALHYYREALESDPRNLVAIAGEGEALAEKGALQKAQRNLARLQGLCGSDCEATRQLAAVLARTPATQVVQVEAVKPQPVISEN